MVDLGQLDQLHPVLGIMVEGWNGLGGGNGAGLVPDVEDPVSSQQSVQTFGPANQYSRLLIKFKKIFITVLWLWRATDSHGSGSIGTPSPNTTSPS